MVSNLMPSYSDLAQSDLEGLAVKKIALHAAELELKRAQARALKYKLGLTRKPPLRVA